MNVRSTASTKLAALDIIHRGDVVKVVEIDENNWAKIALDNDTYAYVYAAYIAKVA
ncbi:MAG: SH3 domain-containing protein [Candidatus Spyradocola sp.]